MDPELRSLLEKNLKVAKENNEILRKVRKFQTRSRMFQIFYWILILGIPLGLYYFLRPFIEQATNLYTGSVSGFGNVMDLFTSFSDADSVNEILQQLEGAKK